MALEAPLILVSGDSDTPKSVTEFKRLDCQELELRIFSYSALNPLLLLRTKHKAEFGCLCYCLH